MKISFDLDGVIAESERWFFRMLNFQFGVRYQVMPGYQFVCRNTHVERGIDLLRLAELDYYSSRPLKYHPKMFMAANDEGYIVTSRKPWSAEVTEAWLKRYGIDIPIVYTDHNDSLDWTDYKTASIMAGRLKSATILDMGIDVHFDNNPFIVDVMRDLTNVRVILVGGETSHL